MNFPGEGDTQFVRQRLAGACDTMKRLLLGLLEANGRVAEDIHEIRKLGKSLRGGLALFRLEDSAARKIQAIGRLLSGPRDAVSRRNTWNKLAWNDDPRVAAAITGLLDQQTLSAAHRPPPKTIAWCIHQVDDARRELLEVAADNLAGHMARGLAKLEQRTCRRCHKLDHRAGPAFHQARKALKAWLGAIAFLPDGLVTPQPKLKQLAELLGDENDLSTLAAWLKNHGFTAEFAPQLWHALRATRHALQREVVKEALDLPPASQD